jgi:hypothetical protein
MALSGGKEQGGISFTVASPGCFLAGAGSQKTLVVAYAT